MHIYAYNLIILGAPMELSEQEAKLRLRLAQIERNEACQTNFLTFVKNMWP